MRSENSFTSQKTDRYNYNVTINRLYPINNNWGIYFKDNDKYQVIHQRVRKFWRGKESDSKSKHIYWYHEFGKIKSILLSKYATEKVTIFITKWVVSPQLNFRFFSQILGDVFVIFCNFVSYCEAIVIQLIQLFIPSIHRSFGYVMSSRLSFLNRFSNFFLWSKFLFSGHFNNLVLINNYLTFNWILFFIIPINNFFLVFLSFI